MFSFLSDHTLEPPPGLGQALPTALPGRCLTRQTSESFSWACPPNLGPLSPLQVRIWEIPEGGLKRNMTEALLELHGHSRRVGLVEWHPTTNNILFSAGYDYKVGNWGGGSCGQSQLSGEGQGERRASLGGL